MWTRLHPNPPFFFRGETFPPIFARKFHFMFLTVTLHLIIILMKCIEMNFFQKIHSSVVYHISMYRALLLLFRLPLPTHPIRPKKGSPSSRTFICLLWIKCAFLQPAWSGRWFAYAYFAPNEECLNFISGLLANGKVCLYMTFFIAMNSDWGKDF